jgi:hypothetical protein
MVEERRADGSHGKTAPRYKISRTAKKSSTPPSSLYLPIAVHSRTSQRLRCSLLCGGLVAACSARSLPVLLLLR